MNIIQVGGESDCHPYSRCTPRYVLSNPSSIDDKIKLKSYNLMDIESRNNFGWVNITQKGIFQLTVLQSISGALHRKHVRRWHAHMMKIGWSPKHVVKHGSAIICFFWLHVEGVGDTTSQAWDQREFIAIIFHHQIIYRFGGKSISTTSNGWLVVEPPLWKIWISHIQLGFTIPK